MFTPLPCTAARHTPGDQPSKSAMAFPWRVRQATRQLSRRPGQKQCPVRLAGEEPGGAGPCFRLTLRTSLRFSLWRPALRRPNCWGVGPVCRSGADAR